MKTIKTEDKIEMKPGYKKTSIGIIPEDWEEMRLEQVSKIIMGVSPNSENYNFEGQGKFLIQGNADIRNRKSAPRQYTSEITKECQVGDILMSVRAPVGEIAKSIHNACIGRGVCAIRNNKKADGEFLFYYLLNTEVLWSRFKQGSTFESVNSTDIRNFTIQIPPIQEQTAIADCLSTWDKGIEKLSALIASKKEQKKGLMQQLLTGKKRLDGFTKEWKEVRLGEITKRITRKNKELDDTVVTISAQRGFVLQEDYFKKRVASSTLSNYYLLDKGEFAYNKSYSKGYPMGAFKRLDDFDKAVVTTLYICFKLKENVDSDFLLDFFEAGLMINNLMRIAQEGGRAHGLLNIGLADFFNLKLRIPDINEQRAIAEILTTADKEIELLEQKLEAFKIQKKGLMQVLLTGALRLCSGTNGLVEN